MSIPFWYNDPSILLNKKHISMNNLERLILADPPISFSSLLLAIPPNPLKLIWFSFKAKAPFLLAFKRLNCCFSAFIEGWYFTALIIFFWAFSLQMVIISGLVFYH